ncbi:hypothetical protein AVEN_94810-1 [Araneus ventricosus]|uniref:RNA-directed DNA polymerase n=1 Tax=Araneus ventricosus TaxID=182803 RepID=A0A4Y2CNP6_ARAVE|nr:hypothetical protein AVEN_94810-1 [Araneus ventricosus]
MTDASDFAVGAVHRQHIESKVEPLGFFPRKLSSTEKKYSTFDRELLSVYLSVKHFRYVFEGREVVIYTDHKPLVFAFTLKSTVLLVKSGTLNLSANSQLTYVTLQWFGGRSIFGSRTAIIDGFWVGLELRPVHFASSEKSLYCDVSTGTVCPYVTKSFRRQIFKQIHNLSHPGVKTTQKLVAARFVWNNMNKDCELWCRNCIQCQKSKVARHNKSAVGHFPLPSAHFSHLHIDVVGPLSPVRGMTYLLTCVDRFTR